MEEHRMNNEEQKKVKPEKSKRFWIFALVLVFLTGLGTAVVFHDYEAQQEADAKASSDLVSGLNANGWELYTNSRCPWCMKQKDIIGDSVKYLNVYVCDQSQADNDRCVVVNVTRVPSWYNTETGELLADMQNIEALELMAE
jgi:hypothetical protein